MAVDYTCIHEEQIQGQSRAIERLNAELSYKKEKFDDIKAVNNRMEKKIDNLQECMNKIMLKSTTDDEKLNNRLTAIETRLDTQEKTTKENRDDTNLKIGILGVVLVIIDFIIKYAH